MNRIGKHLSAGLDVLFETTVATVVRDNDKWTLFDDANRDIGRFDWLVLTAPAPQTGDLVRDFEEIVEVCRARTMRGCFALMLGFEQPLELPWQAALVRNTDISWVSVNSSKPGRSAAFTLVVHSTNAWADAHMDDDIDRTLEHMTGEAQLVTGENLAVATHREVHRWRYANIDSQKGPGYFVDDNRQLAMCGDWLVRGRVEAAFTSANDLGLNLQDRV